MSEAIDKNVDNQTLSSDRTQSYYNDESFIKIRLDTDNVLTKLELFLNSCRVVTVMNPETNLLQDEIRSIGTPLCNTEGVNGIMQLTSMLLNSQTVQGNFDEEMYKEFIYFSRRELTHEIVHNRVKWGIGSESLQMIIDCLMRTIKAFMSRTINNLERESYKGGFQTREVIMRDPNKSSGFFGGLGRA